MGCSAPLKTVLGAIESTPGCRGDDEHARGLGVRRHMLTVRRGYLRRGCRWTRAPTHTALDGEYKYRQRAPTNGGIPTSCTCGSRRATFLVTFIDAFSRYGVHHRLLIELNGSAVGQGA